MIRGPYIQRTSPSAIVIIWRTGTEIAPVVRYGLRPDRLPFAAPPEAIACRHPVQKGVGTFAADDTAQEGERQYEARLGLLRQGDNVLAIEAHNADPAGKAFTLDPILVTAFE